MVENRSVVESSQWSGEGLSCAGLNRVGRRCEGIHSDASGMMCYYSPIQAYYAHHVLSFLDTISGDGFLDGAVSVCVALI